MFKIKTGYYLELLTPEIMKLLGSTKSNRTKDTNGENVPYLGITKAALIRWNVVSSSYQMNSRVLHMFANNNLFGQLLDMPPKNFLFLKTLNF